MLIAEFDRRQGWADGKLPSCAHWLNFKCGLNLGAAREKVRVAHALAGLPKIAAAMARGELSYSKARAVSRVACEATEEHFLMIALHGTAHHVESLVRGYRRAQQAEELSREAQQHANRGVSYEYAEDGSVVLKARLPAVAGALLIQALEAALERIPAKEICADMVEERPIPYACRRADALAHVAESFLAESGPLLDRPPIAIKSSYTWTPRPARAHGGRCEIEQDLHARRDRAPPRLRCEPAERARERARRAARCGAQDAQHPAAPSAARSAPATPAAASPAAPTSAMSTRTTSSTGPTAGRPNSPTS